MVKRISYLDRHDAHERIQRTRKRLIRAFLNHLYQFNAKWLQSGIALFQALAEHVNVHHITGHAGPLRAHTREDVPYRAVLGRAAYLL